MAGTTSIAFVRLENTNDNHFKFYEMTFQGRKVGIQQVCDVVVKYGRIGTEGKTIFLRGNEFPTNNAENIGFYEAKNAFLKQLKKKFRDKEYTLEDISTSDEKLKEEIEELQNQFDGYNAIAVRLENRSF